MNIFRLLEYWVETPPAHISLAAQMPRMAAGAQSAAPAAASSRKDTESGMAELAAMAGPAMKRAAPDGFSELLQWVEEKEAILKKA